MEPGDLGEARMKGLGGGSMGKVSLGGKGTYYLCSLGK